MGDFMGKRVNVFLLLMIIIVVAALGGITIYYQHILKTQTNESTTLNSSLLACQMNLTNTIDYLTKTMQNLNSTETDIRKYDALYEQKAQELEGKKDDLVKSQAQLNSMTILKQQFQKQAEAQAAQITELNANITAYKQKVTSLENQINNLEEIRDCLREADSEAEKIACY